MKWDPLYNLFPWASSAFEGFLPNHREGTCWLVPVLKINSSQGTEAENWHMVMAAFPESSPPPPPHAHSQPFFFGLTYTYYALCATWASDHYAPNSCVSLCIQIPMLLLHLRTLSNAYPTCGTEAKACMSHRLPLPILDSVPSPWG